MKIIEPAVELVDTIDAADIYRKIEICGRVAHQSMPKCDPKNFVYMLIRRGHESVLEHVSLTFHIITDRAIQNELVRHRHCAFTVESTRFVKYDELSVIEPPVWEGKDDYWYLMCKEIEQEYKTATFFGTPPEIARAVLPLCLKSELYMTANLREWRHFLKLRTDKAAHPQMRLIAGLILNIFKDKLPVIVEDIGGETVER